MELTIVLDDEQERLIAAEGDPCEYIQGLIAKECKRLWHIERCKPKPKGNGIPGPRRMSAVEREVRNKGDLLRGVYLKLREFYGEEYPPALVQQELEIERAIAAEDLATLTRYTQEQPWQRR